MLTPFASPKLKPNVPAVLGALLLAGTHALAAVIDAPNIAALRSLDPATLTNDDLALLPGYFTPGDRGGGMFVWQTKTNAPDDGGQVIQPGNKPPAGRWVRVFNGNVPNVKMWGATGDGKLGDDTSRIQKAIRATKEGPARELLFPTGTYIVTNTLVFPAHLHIRGEGQIGNTHVIMPMAYAKDVFRTRNADLLLKGKVSDCDHGLVFENIYIRMGNWDEPQDLHATNAGLMLSSPGEGHIIRNISTVEEATGFAASELARQASAL